jgi:hypothetical protein
MKYLSVRELRNEPGMVWSRLKVDDLVVTVDGRPVGILMGVDEGEFEEALVVLQRARAALAISRMRREAAARGLDRLTPGQVDAEIQRSRKRRRA